MPNFNAVYKPSQLILGSGNIAIACGWTIKEAIAKRLEPEEYAVIGNLYSSTRGLSPLIRNLLLNPHVHHIVILSATKQDKNSGSSQCLFDFFDNGFHGGVTDLGHKCWIVNSPIQGYVDIEIPYNVLEEVRSFFCEFVTLEDSINSAITKVKAIVDHSPKELLVWRLPQEFPIASTASSSSLPGPLYGHRVEGTTISSAWVNILQRVMNTGIIRPTGYGGNVKELINVMTIITDEPEGFYFPEPNFLPVDRAFVDEYIPQILEDAEYLEGVKYTYAQRLLSYFNGHNQIEEVIQKLITEIDSTSCVMNLWDSGGNINRRKDGSSDHQHSGSPCLNHIWVKVTEGKLSLTATFRSHDVFSAWAANAFGLRALQEYILNEYLMRVQMYRDGEINLPYPVDPKAPYYLSLSNLTICSESCHCYEDTFAYAEKVVAEHYRPQPKYTDPVGNFLIELDKDICVSQTTPGSGEVVKKYNSNNPLSLIRQITNTNPAIAPDHAAYLGIELQKAKIALDTSQKYIQDVP